MNAEKRRQIFERLAAANTNPTTELEYENTFQLLIAVLLSAQATDKSVNLATRHIFDTCKTPQDILDMGLDTFTEKVRTIGLYKTKAKNALATCAILQEQYNGAVPDTREALEALPGVGRKTANVVLNTAFGQPAMAVDTHIFRVSNRTGLAPGKNVSEVEDKLMRFVPKEYLLDAHHWLILHGRYICVARAPKCLQCGIEDLCEFKEKNLGTPPKKRPAKKAASVRKVVKKTPAARTSAKKTTGKDKH
ncbi:endonuclease IV [Advenella kashmirensis W13003]|uniref:Endonuclease III n=1 Tax=Advenella kashmirensis W13003 TaxID=1424334 RepID=V8QQS7_9BURK|nr:endonuclease III [Advenella kashmirensis]ETF01655.1 endonuclease IV [Advenella kashmirensis W13003]